MSEQSKKCLYDDAAESDSTEFVYDEKLSQTVRTTYRTLCQTFDGAILDYELDSIPISGVGENSYGLVLQVKLHPTRTLPTFAPVPDFYTVLKISPKNAARRAHMSVADFYAREVFMYERVFNIYRQLAEEQQECSNKQLDFDIVPKMHFSSLQADDEFIIFDDLTRQGYTQNLRTKMPTYDLVACSLIALGKLHGMSFVLAAKKPNIFAALVEQISDNLFTADMQPVQVQFGKKQIVRTREMLEKDLSKLATQQVQQMVDVLKCIEENFQRICLDCVNGKAAAPYAVICHGDFWNNNILYKYDPTTMKAVDAKLIDFQMSRYAPPVLDLVHYLFACTEKDLRDAHYKEFLQIYYDALHTTINDFELNAAEIYPSNIYEQQLRDFGIYGFCMAAYGIPFFISDTSEIPDLDIVSQAIQELPSPSAASSEVEAASSDDADIDKSRQLVEEFDLLSERTIPIFKRRMTDIVRDLIAYDMVADLFKLRV